MPRGNGNQLPVPDLPDRPQIPIVTSHAEYPGVQGTITRDRVAAGVTPLPAYLEEQQALDAYFYDTDAQIRLGGDSPENVSRVLQRNCELQQRLCTLRNQREPLVRDISDRLIRGEYTSQAEFELAMKDLVDSGVEGSFLLESKLMNETGKMRMDALLRSLNIGSIQVEGMKEMTSEQPPLNWRLWRRTEQGRLESPLIQGVYNKMPGWLHRTIRKTAVTGGVGSIGFGIASVLFGPVSWAIWGTGMAASAVMGGLVEMERVGRQKGDYEAYAKSLVGSVKKMHDLAKEWRDESDVKKKEVKLSALLDFVRDQDKKEAVKGLKTVAQTREAKDKSDKFWEYLDGGMRVATGGVSEAVHAWLTGQSGLQAMNLFFQTFKSSAVGFGTAEVGTAATNYGRGLVRHARHHRQGEARQQHGTELKSFVERPPAIYSPADQVIFNYQPGAQGRDGSITPLHPVLKRVTEQLRQFPTGSVTFRNPVFIQRNYPEVARLGPHPLVVAVSVDKNFVTLVDPVEPSVTPTAMALTEFLRAAVEIRSVTAANEEHFREIARTLGKEYPAMDDIWRLGPPGYDGQAVAVIAVNPSLNQIRYVPDDKMLNNEGAIRTMDLSIFLQYYHLAERPPADPTIPPAPPAPPRPAAPPAQPQQPPQPRPPQGGASRRQSPRPPSP